MEELQIQKSSDLSSISVTIWSCNRLPPTSLSSPKELCQILGQMWRKLTPYQAGCIAQLVRYYNAWRMTEGKWEDHKCTK